MVLAAMRVNAPAAAHKVAWRRGAPKIYHVDKRPRQTNSVVLRGRNIDLSFAEIKGPVLERLQRSPLLDQLSGKIFLSTHQAFLQFAGTADDYSI